jgi:hypothetical protein
MSKNLKYMLTDYSERAIMELQVCWLSERGSL